MLSFKSNKPCKVDLDISGIIINSAISLSYANGKSDQEINDEIDKLIESKYGNLENSVKESLENIKMTYLKEYFPETQIQARTFEEKPESGLDNKDVKLISNDILTFDNSLGLNTEGDILKMFNGNQLINNALNHMLNDKILLKTIVDLDQGTIVKDNAELTSKIEDFKLELLKKLDNSYTRTQLNSSKRMSEILNTFRQQYEAKKMTSEDLYTLYKNKEDLDKFLSFILLDNFDDVIKIKFGSVISISKQNIGKVEEKYAIKDTANLGTGFTDEHIIRTHTQLSTMLIETTPVIDFNGNRKENQFLKKDVVVAVFNKLKPLIPTTNIDATLGVILAEFMRTKLNGGKMDLSFTFMNSGLENFNIKSLNLNDIEYSVLFSMYNRFFKSSFNNSILNEGNVATDFLKNSSDVNKFSFLEVYARNETNLLDMYDVMVSTISKVVPTTINEATYDFNEKTIIAKDLKSTVTNKYISEYNNHILFNTKKELKFSSEINHNIQDGVSKLSLKSGNYIIYNIQPNKNSLKYFDKSGNEIELEYPSYIDSKETGSNQYADFYEVLNFMEDALNIGINKGDNLLINEIISKRGKNGIDSLLALALNTSIIDSVFTLKNVNRLDTIPSQMTTIVDSIPLFKNIKKEIVNKKFATLNPNFNSMSSKAIEYLVEAKGVLKGDVYKSTSVDAEGAMQPTYGLINPISNYNTSFQILRTENNQLLRNNPFVKNIGLLSGLSRRGSVQMADGTVQSSAKLSIADTIMYDIRFDYIQSKINDDILKFQPTTFSDKNTHTAIHLDGNKMIDFYGEQKRYGDLTPLEHKQFHFQSQSDYYNETLNRFLQIHNYILKNNQVDLVAEYFNNSDLKEILGEIPGEKINVREFKEQYPDYYDESILNQIIEFDKILSFVEDDQHINSIQELMSIMSCFSYKQYAAIAEKALKPFKEDFLLEYHARKNPSTGKAELNQSLISFFKTYSNTGYNYSNDSEYQMSNYYGKDFDFLIDVGKYKYKEVEDPDNPGFTLLTELYDDQGNSLDLNRTSIGYEAKMLRGKLAFIDSIKRSNIKFDLENENGEEDPLMKKAIIHYNIGNEWIDNNTKRLIPFIGNNLNPILEEYFYAHKITKDFQHATVGDITQHKGYGKNEVEESAGKTIAMFKRMVAHQATLQIYKQNKKDGISSYINTMYTEDPAIELTNVLGETHNQDAPDGAGFTLGVHRVLEQNSLDDQVAEFQGHKSISIQMNKDGTAGLGKWAQFALSNQFISLSPTLRALNKKMLLGRDLKTPDGNSYYKFNLNGKEFNLDLTVDYKGRNIPAFKTMKGLENGLFYIDENDHVIEILRMDNAFSRTNQYTPSTTYLFKCIDHTLKNNTMNNKVGGNYEFTREVEINNLYDLYQALGGESSIELDPEGNILVERDGDTVSSYSIGEGSNYALAWFVNNIGTYKPSKMMHPNKLSKSQNDEFARYVDQFGSKQKAIDFMNSVNYNTDFTNSEGFKVEKDSQLNIFQPLKMMYIAQNTFVSAQKVGARNVNSAKILSNDATPWITSNVPTLHSGIQLDYGHHVEDSDVTEMTQIISAVVFNGETPKYAENIYNTIASYVRNKVTPIINGLNSSDLIERRKTLNRLEKEVVNNFIGETDVVARDIMNKTLDTLTKEYELLTRKKEDLTGDIDAANDIQSTLDQLKKIIDDGQNVPVSNQALYNKIFSTVSSYFTKQLIRRKPTGFANVIMPSTTFVKMREVPNIDLNSESLINNGTVVLNDFDYNRYIKKIRNSKWFVSQRQLGVPEENLFRALFEKEINSSELSMGMTVVINGQDRYINSINDIFKAIRDNGSDKMIQKTNAERELQTFNAFWTIKGEPYKKYSMQQNYNTTKSFVIKEFANISNKIIKLSTDIDSDISNFKKQKAAEERDKLVKQLVSNFEFYSKFLPDEMLFEYFGAMPNVKNGSYVILNKEAGMRAAKIALAIEEGVDPSDLSENIERECN